VESLDDMGYRRFFHNLPATISQSTIFRIPPDPHSVNITFG